MSESTGLKVKIRATNRIKEYVKENPYISETNVNALYCICQLEYGLAPKFVNQTLHLYSRRLTGFQWLQSLKDQPIMITHSTPKFNGKFTLIVDDTDGILFFSPTHYDEFTKCLITQLDLIVHNSNTPEEAISWYKNNHKGRILTFDKHKEEKI